MASQAASLLGVGQMVASVTLIAEGILIGAPSRPLPRVVAPPRPHAQQPRLFLPTQTPAEGEQPVRKGEPRRFAVDLRLHP